MKTGLLMAAGLAMAGFAAQAKTVAWYHFDEGVPGTRTTGDTVFTNAIDAAVGPGTAHVWHKNVYNPPTVNTTPEKLMPAWTNAFEDFVAVYDPVTSNVVTSTTALHIVSEDHASAGSAASQVQIEDNAKFHNKSFTIEFMIKLPSGAATTWRHIIYKAFPNNKPGAQFTAWPAMLTVYLNSTTIGASFTPTNGAAMVSVTSGRTITDGNWHHVAVVVDGSERTLSVYTDGGWQKTSTAYEADPDYTGDTPLTICTSPKCYYGSWDGVIDEVRISDEALAPEQFLKFASHAPVSKLTDANTLFHLPFAGSLESQQTTLSYGISTLTCIPAFLNDSVNHADAFTGLIRKWVDNTEVSGSYELVPDVKHDRLVPEKTSDVAVVNVSSYHTVSPADKSYPPALVLQDGYAMARDSFTLEFFGKMAAGEPSSSINQYAFLVQQNGGFAMFSYNNGRVNVSTAAGELFGSTGTPTAYNDGKWHHFALVYDKKATQADSTLDFYVDYKAVGHQDGAYFALNDSSRNGLTFFGYYYHYIYGPRDFKMDELRITRGALTPDQFIQKEHLGLMMIVR